jgi:tRNA-splicing ligase RtcB
MNSKNYQIIEPSSPTGVPVKAWINGVPLDEGARTQLKNISKLPFIYKWVAAMPDVHWGIGATVGSVIPTYSAIIPAAVGVDIGCGMMAVKTSLKATDLPDDLKPLRLAVEQAIPVGRTDNGGRNDRGAWKNPPQEVPEVWKNLFPRYSKIIEKYPRLGKGNEINQLGTLGTGNHFVEICLDEAQQVWFMLHSGSRGVGNRFGTYFIELAQQDMRTHLANLPDKNLAYFEEGTNHFADYVEAVGWAQDYAMMNRKLMMSAMVRAIQQVPGIPPFQTSDQVVNCHHNYVSKETHYGNEVYVTRKGAVRAQIGDLGIIPGSMGARSYIVRGKGNPESFHSCSHGAGRALSRTEAKKRFTIEDHERATAGIECRKDKGVIDETPAAYKDIDQVMKAQSDLIEIVHTLRQVVCVKG